MAAQPGFSFLITNGFKIGDTVITNGEVGVIVDFCAEDARLPCAPVEAHAVLQLGARDGERPCYTRKSVRNIRKYV